jgi:UDP-glucose 4-epimerase
MANYLVTGGAGFIGSNLAEQLSRNNVVVIIDNLLTGSVKNIPPGAIWMKGVTLKQFCTEEHRATDTREPFKFDGIFHLGQPSSTPMYRADRHLIGKAISDFIYLAEYAFKNNIKMVYASSSSVYNGNETPWREDMNLLPTDFYTEVRIAYERIASVYHQMHQLKAIGLRLFSVYGPHEESKKQYANLITQMLWAKQRGEVFDIYGNGEQRRDATYVNDIVRAFILAMKSPIECEVFNVGTGVSYSLNEIAERIGTKIRYVPVPFSNYVDATMADTTKAEKFLGFKARISLNDGLQQLNDYYHTSD